MRFVWLLVIETTRRRDPDGESRPLGAKAIYWAGVGLGVLGVAALVIWKVWGVYV